MSWPGVIQRRIASNGIQMNIAEAGRGPLVLLLHGFPESWYSWRHQFAPLAAAGYHVVAPDMRGYGKTDKPHEIEAYTQVEIVKDVIGLIPALGYDQAIVIGHDWGAPTAWATALFHPDKVRAVGGLSVPFMTRFAGAADADDARDVQGPVLLPALFLRAGHCRGGIRAGHPHVPEEIPRAGRR